MPCSQRECMPFTADVGFKQLNLPCLLCSLLSSHSRSQTFQVRGCPPPFCTLCAAGLLAVQSCQTHPAAGRQNRKDPGDAVSRCWMEQCSIRLQILQQDNSCPGLESVQEAA